MADISKLEEQADLLFNNVAGWESSTLQRIGKRIGKYGKMRDLKYCLFILCSVFSIYATAYFIR